MHELRLEWPDVEEVCLFNQSASNFFTKYIVDSQDWVVKPCVEFVLFYLTHGFLLFCTILTYFQVSRLSRIPSEAIRLILTCRLFVMFSTVIILSIYIFLGLFSSITQPLVLMLEYGMAASTWLAYAFVWILAIKHDTWPRPSSLMIAYNLAVLALFLTTYQNVRHFGYGSVQGFGVIFISVCQAGNLILQIFEWRKARNWQLFQQLVDTNDSVSLSDNGDESAGFFSSLFFCWVNPLILAGYKGCLRNVDNLFCLPATLRVATIENDFFGNASNEHVDNEEFSFAIGLLRTFGFKYFSLAILRFFADLMTFSGIILLHLLITSLQVGGAQNTGFVYASLMLILSFSAAMCDFNFNFYINKIALKVRAAILVALYDKLLQLPQYQLSNFSSGQLINFMSTDVDRIVSFCTSFHAAWSMPFNIVIALYLLYREVGMASLSGLFCAILMVPLNKYIASKIGQMSVKLMAFKDQRLKLVTETIRGIRTVKVSNWESYFKHRISRIRQKELKYLKKRKYLDAVCVYLWASAPLLIIIVILTTYTVVLGEKLTPAKVFTSLALVNILILPLNAFPWVLNSLIEAYVSKRRLDTFFSLKSVLLNYIYSLTESADQLLVLDNARFMWSNDFSVGPISVTGTRSMIVGISGAVGSGKSTTLLGILGEAIAPQDVQALISGIPSQTTLRIRQTTVREGFAYVGQESWVRRGTIRDNILCGSQMNEIFYRHVLDATALSKDIEKMPEGDLYTIADDGSTLSGGQRARLALARAIYQESDIYILDDLFASLDHKVGRFVWKNAIEGLLRSRGRLVLIVTHNKNFLRQTDLIIHLDQNGQVQSIARPSEFFKQNQELDPIDNLEMVETFDMNEPTDHCEDSETSTLPLFDRVEHVQEVVPEEQMEHGTVKQDIYWFYLQAVGFGLAVLIGASLLAMQASKNLSDVWLSKWTLNSTQNVTSDWSRTFFYGRRLVNVFADDEDKLQTRYYLTIFVCLAGANTVFTLFRAFLFAYGGVVAARNLHSALLSRVLTSSIAFWDRTPWGRVVNRLCADVYLVDDSLPFQLNIFLATVVNLTGALILSVVALPFLLVIVLVLFILYFLIQRYYRHTTCEVKRLTSLTLSPLYGHITDTVTGLVTIRAFRFMPRFMEKLRQLLEDHLRAKYCNIAASQWLSVRLQLLGVLMVSAISFTAVIESKFFHVESGLIALSITYALTMTNLLNNILSSFIETEKELVSVERIVDYIQNIPTEESNPEVVNVDRFLFCRTVMGQVDFSCVSMRYAPNLPLALNNITFHLDAGQWAAIIGRTGSGKSSIFQALLRAYPIENGKIFIDTTIDLYKLDPKAVRSLFGVITQTPFLFSGTIRENLCMDNKDISDGEIYRVLCQANLSDWLERAGGLDAEVVEAGANFSFGEKQIICVCRLVLSRPKIVLIDEGTAYMDFRSHTMMNNLIRSTLPTATVISIVHRTIGLEEFDYVIEISNGRILKQGSPLEVISKD